MDQLDTKLETLESKRQECEVFSRVCGYMRPVSQWNDCKRAEFGERVEFIVKEEC